MFDWAMHQAMSVLGVSTSYEVSLKSRLYTTHDVSPLVKQDVLLMAGTEDHVIPLSQTVRRFFAHGANKPMTLTRKRILVGLAAFVCVAVVAVVSSLALIVYVFSRESRAPSDYESAIKCTLEWGRLSPFPPSAQQLSVSIEGGLFTRGFRVSFIAPPADLERWLQESPGIRETSPTKPSPGIRHFDIAPGGGAQHAEVSVDDSTNRVSIYVYWS